MRSRAEGCENLFVLIPRAPGLGRYEVERERQLRNCNGGEWKRLKEQTSATQ